MMITEFGERFPSVAIVTPDEELRSRLQEIVVQLGTKTVTMGPCIAVLPDSGFWNTSLAMVDLDVLQGVQPGAFRSTTPLCWVVVVGDPMYLPPLWWLMQWGVDDFAAKSLSPEQLQQRLLGLPSDPLAAAKDLARSWVGYRGVRDVQAEIRAAMYSEALARSAGNKCRAARLLQVTRAAVQKELRGY